MAKVMASVIMAKVMASVIMANVTEPFIYQSLFSVTKFSEFELSR